MDLANVRRALPIVYGGIVAILWLTVQGSVATTFTLVGALLLGLFYALDRGTPEQRRTRTRDRNR